MTKNDLTGIEFGRLKVVKFVGVNKWRSSLWSCICECGNETIVNANLLRNGKTKSCGCLNKEITSRKKKTHGMSNTDFYRVWNSMIMRCHNEKSTSYKNYGGRGIKVCKRWRTFENFLVDMMPSYKQGLSLDRIDNSKGYCKDNCKWTTPIEQSNNTRRNRMVTFNNETLTMSQMARKHNIPVNTFKRRLYLGWDVERALKNKI